MTSLVQPSSRQMNLRYACGKLPPWEDVLEIGSLSIDCFAGILPHPSSWLLVTETSNGSPELPRLCPQCQVTDALAVTDAAVACEPILNTNFNDVCSKDEAEMCVDALISLVPEGCPVFADAQGMTCDDLVDSNGGSPEVQG